MPEIQFQHSATLSFRRPGPSFHYAKRLPRLILGAGLLLALLGASEPRVDEFTTYDTPRFTLRISKDASAAPPKNGSRQDIASFAMQHVNEAHDELEALFGASPKRRVVLSFLSPEAFSVKTGAPSWTSAMFYRDEISVPISANEPLDSVELGRALSHEYVHAFMAQLSAYRCPAWLDEGIAQIFEGEPNPLLAPALRRWTLSKRSMKLDDLQGGFTTLEQDLVPAAYAHSYFASRELLASHGFSGISNYLRSLSYGFTPREAFKKSFGISQQAFEARLQEQLLAWSRTNDDLK